MSLPQEGGGFGAGGTDGGTQPVDGAPWTDQYDEQLDSPSAILGVSSPTVKDGRTTVFRIPVAAADSQSISEEFQLMSTCRVVISGVCWAAILIAATSLAGAEKAAEKPVMTFDPVKQFEHIGVFTAEKQPNERYVAATKVWVTDFPNHPYRIEWLRTDRPFRGPNPHIAFRVENIEQAARAAKGLKSVSKPFDAGIARVAFYQTDDGASVEFMEYYDAPAKQTPTPLRFDHIGLIAAEKKPNETFVAATKVWVTDIPSHPYRVEWLRFEPDSPVKGPVREMPHVAFRVDSIAQAAKGLKTLIEPFDAGIAIVTFYQARDGAVVEFMEYHKK